tara:strand:+ start:45106 stop:46344 length:1239 start_codon:yes stop_codon:yes gene_type:complete
MAYLFSFILLLSFFSCKDNKTGIIPVSNSVVTEKLDQKVTQPSKKQDHEMKAFKGEFFFSIDNQRPIRFYNSNKSYPGVVELAKRNIIKETKNLERYIQSYYFHDSNLKRIRQLLIGNYSSCRLSLKTDTKEESFKYLNYIDKTEIFLHKKDQIYTSDEMSTEECKKFLKQYHSYFLVLKIKKAKKYYAVYDEKLYQFDKKEELSKLMNKNFSASWMNQEDGNVEVWWSHHDEKRNFDFRVREFIGNEFKISQLKSKKSIVEVELNHTVPVKVIEQRRINGHFRALREAGTRNRQCHVDYLVIKNKSFILNFDTLDKKNITFSGPKNSDNFYESGLRTKVYILNEKDLSSEIVVHEDDAFTWFDYGYLHEQDCEKHNSIYWEYVRSPGIDRNTHKNRFDHSLKMKVKAYEWL